MRKLLIILLTNLFLGNTCLSDCNSVLKSCDAALNAQVELNKQKDSQLKNYENESDLQKQIISDQQRSLDSWYHDPIKVAAGTTVLILVLEIATGAFKK